MVSKIADLIKIQRYVIQEVFVQGPSSIHILLTDEVRWICMYVTSYLKQREITPSSFQFILSVHSSGFLSEFIPFYIVELVPFGTASSGCQTSSPEVMGLSPRAIPGDQKNKKQKNNQLPVQKKKKVNAGYRSKGRWMSDCSYITEILNIVVRFGCSQIATAVMIYISHFLQ